MIRTNSVKGFMKSKEGSFTIEASLVFPIIFLLVLSMIFISMYIYQKASLYYIASCTADRIAFNWNNSYKDFSTGEVAFGKYEDSLYWRLTDDRLLDSLLVLTNDYKPIEVNINDNNSIGDSLPENKLINNAGYLPNGVNGKIIYHNYVQREIIVELESQIKIPIFIANLVGDKINARAESTITEPVEFIRTIDFVRRYSHILEENKDKVKDILSKQKARK